jgi:hypothetical protein
MTSILSAYDIKNAALKENLDILNNIMQDYDIPVDLFKSCKKFVEY